MLETWVQSLSWEDPLEMGKATRVFWPGELHGPWGCKESDTTERLSLSLLSCSLQLEKARAQQQRPSTAIHK